VFPGWLDRSCFLLLDPKKVGRFVLCEVFDRLGTQKIGSSSNSRLERVEFRLFLA
jgi:hypothetical protein